MKTSPIRAAFYYGWFPETWGSGTNYEPVMGRYDSLDPAVIQAHIYMMRYANIRAGIVSWWGKGKPYSDRFEVLLDAAVETGFRWCPYYEEEGYAAPSVEAIRADLDAFTGLTARPEWLKMNGKPVLFVYADPGDNASMVSRWVAANAGQFYLVLKVFPGFEKVNPRPDDWHQYAPANNVQDHPPYSFTVSPGFWKADEPNARLVRDPSRFRADVMAMNASEARWHLITCFNEFGEGTAIEPTTDWGSLYLDILRRH